MSGDRCRCGDDLPGQCPGPAFCPMEAPRALQCAHCGRDDNDAEDRGGIVLCVDCADIWKEEDA